jgi:fructose-1,6-bisphosphatase/inositol monophosphatase family enzyme
VYIELAEARLGYAYFSRAWPWDHAAGACIHAEAGGHGGFFDGAPYDARRHHGPLLFAPEPATWRILVDRLLAPS